MGLHTFLLSENEEIDITEEIALIEPAKYFISWSKISFEIINVFLPIAKCRVPRRSRRWGWFHRQGSVKKTVGNPTDFYESL